MKPTRPYCGPALIAWKVYAPSGHEAGIIHRADTDLDRDTGEAWTFTVTAWGNENGFKPTRFYSRDGGLTSPDRMMQSILYHWRQHHPDAEERQADAERGRVPDHEREPMNLELRKKGKKK